MSVSLLILLIVLVAVPVGIAILVYLVVPVCKGVVWTVGHVSGFLFRELGDTLRILGALLTTLVLVPLTVANVLVGRWSGAAHYGRAIETEMKAVGGALYRVAIGNPARLLCLGALTEGIERRLPEVVAASPGPDRPGPRAGQFDGYRIVGSLQTGGSGGKLYVAEPTPEKLASLSRQGATDVGRVVIKSFSLRDGSSLPQIVRENRALPAARRLGLILEHELTDERFYYVMRYVPGDSLGLVTQRLHAASGPDGLDAPRLRQACEHAADLLHTLCHYHSGGLWHKDVKPDNIIVSTDGRAHLVDFGLITPLRSSMTLTTHGTEYFRDPEMVRLALRGVKVHEVDGARFDVYAAGAVLYSVVENSFPAHGGLSQISRRCPEAVRWIVRRAMADYDKRYASAAAMLADLEAVLAAPDPYALRPVQLPSFRAEDAHAPQPCEQPGWEGDGVVLGASAMRSTPALSHPADRPRIRVTSWWTGRYAVEAPPQAAPLAPAFSPSPGRVAGLTAAEQLARARARGRAARERARARMAGHDKDRVAGLNPGVAVAVLVFLGLIASVVFAIVGGRDAAGRVSVAYVLDDGSVASTEPGGRAGVRVRIDAPPAGGADLRPVRGDDRPTDALVLRDPVTFQPDIKPAIDAQVLRLAEAGFRVLGDGLPATGTTAEQSETIARLRHAVGLHPIGTPQAAEAIRAWLDAEGGGQADLVVWFGRADAAEPHAWVIAPTTTDAGTIRSVAAALEPSASRR